MSEHGGEIDNARRLVDRGGLHRGDLMLAQSLTHDLEPARQRRIAEQPCAALPVLWFDGADQRFLRIGEFDLRLGQRGGECRNRGARTLHRRPLSWWSEDRN